MVPVHVPTSVDAWPQRNGGSVNELTRRALFGLATGGAATALIGCQTSSPVSRIYTAAAWRAERGSRYFIGHRGSGDVFPEHTLPAYEGALAWGAKAIEVSVCISSDGVLVCHHDLTLDRTTTLTGRVDEHPIAAIDKGRVDLPRLGPYWQGARRPQIPHLDRVLEAVGGKAVLCIEAKAGKAFEPMVRLLQQTGLQESAIIKIVGISPRLSVAQAAGFPIFAYIGEAEAVTPQAIDEIAVKLNPNTDSIVLPAFRPGEGFLEDALIQHAVATGVPTWVFPIHRRSEAEHFFALGVQGQVTSSYQYVAERHSTFDSWPQDRIGPGEMTRAPDSSSYALQWREAGVVSFTAKHVSHFITLAQFAQEGTPRGFTLDLELRFDEISERDMAFSVAFGHDDDAYYHDGFSTRDGFHVKIYKQGELGIFRHRAQVTDGQALGTPTPSPAPRPGQWVPMRLEVSGTEIRWSRRDVGSTATASAAPLTGPYIHLGRTSDDGSISVRNVRYTQVG